ncbi:GNAT family N-acetyltransferase [Shimia ponticola]|uniref:GNAT family N-acetyltransferase n=1 Tax=Shimia ponticola TaxID=2582893 RepID=UPI0021062CF2|nr:GNAT family protein [Shimia ponticola]
MSRDLGRPISRKSWSTPPKAIMAGQYTQLVPLSPDQAEALWPVVSDAADSFTYLRYGPFADQSQLARLLSDLSTRADQPFWMATDETGHAQGWLSICDVYPDDGAFEIGSIWFAPGFQGTRAAREALFLLMCLGMDDHGFERLVWRCQAQNQRSFRAALNLGFTHEGTWRNAAVVDGWQRDIAWFSILRAEWPLIKAAFTSWLASDNFDQNGRQRKRLTDFMAR